MSNQLDKETIAKMCRDASQVQNQIDRGIEIWPGPATELIGDLCCHVMALSAMVEELQAELHNARIGDPTADLIHANRDALLEKHQEAVQRIGNCLRQGNIVMAGAVLGTLAMYHPMNESWPGWPEGSA